MRDSIRSLYAYALAEGEGVGTAYEYAAKAAFVQPLITALRRKAASGAPRVLIAGVPEKYGTSLDFALLAARCSARLFIADDRPPALERARKAIESVRSQAALQGLEATYRTLPSLDAIADLEEHDLLLSCEVLQRVPEAGRGRFAAVMRGRAPLGAVFVPNAENSAHLRISGLGGLTMPELRALFAGARCGYVDMPPFPPGISRTPDQRARASTGFAEAVAMRLLDAYCAAEHLVPPLLKRRVAHIVCAIWGA